MTIGPVTRSYPNIPPGAFRPAVARRLGSIAPYQPLPLGGAEAANGALLRLDANENPYGPSPRTSEVLSRLEEMYRYHDGDSRRLRQELERFTGAPAESLLVGNGGDELISITAHTLLDPGDMVLVSTPTFSMYALSGRLAGGQVIELPRGEDFSIDLEQVRRAVEAHHPKLIYLANPNNPDGSLAPAETIQALLELPLLVVLDEAYIEFCGQDLGYQASWIRQVAQRDNLAVLRTFSKWAGLAALRVGYGAFPGWMAEAAWTVKPPYNTNLAGEAAALAALQDLEYLSGNVQRLKAERRRLAQEFQRLPYLQIYPSEGNFLLCRVVPNMGPDLPAVKAAMETAGIRLRYFDTPRLADHFRVSIGLPGEMDAVVRVLWKWM